MTLPNTPDLKEPINSLPDETIRWKQEERRALWGRLIRWAIALPLILFSFPRFGLLGPFMVLLGCILIASDLITFFVDFVFAPRRLEKVPPLYGIPESLVAKGKYLEAEKEYEKIIQQFPDEVKPHVDLINIAVVHLNNAELAEQLYQRGLCLLKKPAAQETLTRMYTGISSRLKSESDRILPTIPLQKLDDIRERLKRDRRKLWR